MQMNNIRSPSLSSPFTEPIPLFEKRKATGFHYSMPTTLEDCFLINVREIIGTFCSDNSYDFSDLRQNDLIEAFQLFESAIDVIHIEYIDNIIGYEELPKFAVKKIEEIRRFSTILFCCLVSSMFSWGQKQFSAEHSMKLIVQLSQYMVTLIWIGNKSMTGELHIFIDFFILFYDLIEPSAREKVWKNLKSVHEWGCTKKSPYFFIINQHYE